MDQWTGKTAMVTGASSGIGAAVAVALADAGMIVVAAARRLDRLTELQGKVTGAGKILCCQCDVSKENDIEAMIEFAKKYAGGVDVLVNNAAVMATGTVSNCDGGAYPMELVKQCYEINVIGAIKAMRLAVEDMRARQAAGYIIVINSVLGHRIIDFGVMPSSSVYASSKYALTALINTMRLEFSYTNSPIRITSISPGSVDTEMFRETVPEVPDDFPLLKSEDVADAVKFVISCRQNVNVTQLTLQPTGERF